MMRWLAPVLLAFLITASAPGSALGDAQAASPPYERTVLVLYRTTAGPSSFTITISVDMHPKKGAFIGSIFAARDKGRVVSVEPGTATSFGRSGASTYSGGSTTCHTDECWAPFGVGAQMIPFEDDDGSNPTNMLVAAVAGLDWNYRLEADGWIAREEPWRFRYVDGESSDADGVSMFGNGIERFREATAEGGRYGSFAMGMPPCSGASSGVIRRGVGTAVLSGGVEDVATECPPADSIPQIASWATDATTWRFSGDVTGDTTLNHTRLLVIDLPRPRRGH